ncbi:MAG: energy transducer TonB [Bacteroidota bacterium]
MEKLILFMVFVIGLVFAGSAQNNGNKNPYNKNFSVNVTQQAHFPKGDTALYSFMAHNIKYSETAYQNRAYGNVMVSFDVMADSTLTGFLVLSGVGFGVDEEVVRVLSTIKFAPAMANGTAYKSNVIATFPVKAVKQ